MSENKGGRKEGLASLLGRMVMAMMAMSASTDDQQQWLWIVGNVMSWGLACVLLAVIAGRAFALVKQLYMLWWKRQKQPAHRKTNISLIKPLKDAPDTLASNLASCFQVLQDEVSCSSFVFGSMMFVGVCVLPSKKSVERWFFGLFLQPHQTELGRFLHLTGRNADLR